MSAPGRVRVALAELISGYGYSTEATRYLPRTTHEFDCDPRRLWPTQGFWRTNRLADVHPWEGLTHVTTSYRHPDRVEIVESEVGITSWFTMTDLVRSRVLLWSFDSGYEIDPLELNEHWVARDVAKQRGHL